MNLIVFSLFIILYIHLQSFNCNDNQQHLHFDHSNLTIDSTSLTDSDLLPSQSTYSVSTSSSISDFSSSSDSNLTYFQSPLDDQDNYHLFWSINYEAKNIDFEVRIKLRRKFNWFAIGLSDYGESTKSDLCIFWTDHLGKQHFQVRVFYGEVDNFHSKIWFRFRNDQICIINIKL